MAVSPALQATMPSWQLRVLVNQSSEFMSHYTVIRIYVRKPLYSMYNLIHNIIFMLPSSKVRYIVLLL